MTVEIQPWLATGEVAVSQTCLSPLLVPRCVECTAPVTFAIGAHVNVLSDSTETVPEKNL